MQNERASFLWISHINRGRSMFTDTKIREDQGALLGSLVREDDE